MSKYARAGSKDWWKYVDKNWDNLLSIIKSYHPSYGRNYSKNVTAKSAESARQDFVAEIEAEGKIDPEEAYKKRRYGKLLDILNQTWFGVPESTDCWEIPGFAELCTICEDGVPSSSIH